MKKLGIVFKFEFKELINKKSLIITTLVMSLILFAGTFAPRVISWFNKPDETTETPGTGVNTISFKGSVLVSEDPNTFKNLELIFGEFSGITLLDDASTVKDAIIDETYEVAYIFENLSKFKIVKKDSGLNFFGSPVESVLQSALFEKNLQDLGINPDDIYSAQDIKLDVSHETLGRDATQMYFFAFAILFVLYMLILLYGQQVATSVAKEKDSRTMELLITSTDPKILIFGKVFSAGLVGFIQISIMVLFLVIGFFLNKSSYPDFLIESIKVAMSWDVLLVYLFFSFAGYILYLFVYAALGSLVSKVEDVGSAVGSITIIFVIAYLIASMAMPNPDMLVVKICSYIPFVSLFTLPIRYSMTSVTSFELITSGALMLGLTVAVAYLSVYIYRLGSLNYGNRMKLGNVLKNILK